MTSPNVFEEPFKAPENLKVTGIFREDEKPFISTSNSVVPDIFAGDSIGAELPSTIIDPFKNTGERPPSGFTDQILVPELDNQGQIPFLTEAGISTDVITPTDYGYLRALMIEKVAKRPGNFLENATTAQIDNCLTDSIVRYSKKPHGSRENVRFIPVGRIVDQNKDEFTDRALTVAGNASYSLAKEFVETKDYYPKKERLFSRVKKAASLMMQNTVEKTRAITEKISNRLPSTKRIIGTIAVGAAVAVALSGGASTTESKTPVVKARVIEAPADPTIETPLSTLPVAEVFDVKQVSMSTPHTVEASSSKLELSSNKIVEFENGDGFTDVIADVVSQASLENGQAVSITPSESYEIYKKVSGSLNEDNIAGVRIYQENGELRFASNDNSQKQQIVFSQKLIEQILSLSA